MPSDAGRLPPTSESTEGRVSGLPGTCRRLHGCPLRMAGLPKGHDEFVSQARGAPLVLAAAAVATVATVTSCGQPASTGSPTAASESTGSAPTTAPQAGATQGAPGTSAQTEPAAPEADAVITTTAATQEVEGGERGVIRSRTVEVNAAALPRTAAEAARKIELPLFDDTTVVADLDAPEFRSEAGYQTWNGTIAGDKGSTVVLVEQDGVLSGVVSS